MAVFKCKMCGGTIEFEQGSTVGVCDSCGTKQTLPRLDDEKRANLYDRANHFRRSNEFDKAAGIYEQILNEDNTDAEAYWSLVLCRYGIEYVEDPATHKRIPTVNRAQFTSIFMDEDYKSALQYADTAQREVYEAEARAIDEIQKGILEISSKEEPFDVFICYKETDNGGRRTQDSVLANDLYHQLTAEGFKVFFARITLEDKLGSAYEPYIFAALNSAKVMVVLGTKAEYFNSAWVKNEWSRYLALIKQGQKKMLIPAYRDMDPYDLPEEFSHLQAQDMSKLGFMQDLIRGIKKIVSSDSPKAVKKENTAVGGENTNVAPLLKRAFLFLEDGDWESADEYCEKVLDQDPENAEAYLGKLMAELKVEKREALAGCKDPFDNSSNYQKAVRFGADGLSEMLESCNAYINERNESERLDKRYRHARKAMYYADNDEDDRGFEKIASYREAVLQFENIPEYKDAEELAKYCRDKITEIENDMILEKAKKTICERSDKSVYRATLDKLEKISGWRDADEQIRICKEKIEKTIKTEKIIKTVVVFAVIIAAISIAYIILIAPNIKYNKAIKLVDSGDFDSAYALLEEIQNNEEIASSKYDRAIKLINSGDYKSAYMLLSGLNYKDSVNKSDECSFLIQKDELKDIDIDKKIRFGFYEQDNNMSNGKEEIEWKVLDIKENKALLLSEYGLDCKEYNFSDSENTDITWENCTLRAWMNDIFINEAFGFKHREMIVSTNLSADKNPDYDTDPGNATIDKIFLLSIDEVNKYFSNDEARECVPTDFAISNGDIERFNSNIWRWWLRSPGCGSYSAVYVDIDGSVEYMGRNVLVNQICVRPAMWIDLGMMI